MFPSDFRQFNRSKDVIYKYNTSTDFTSDIPICYLGMVIRCGMFSPGVLPHEDYEGEDGEYGHHLPGVHLDRILGVLLILFHHV